ncbi:hypothetical protein GGQ97_002324 [Sphingomonas kaistensis]|uniref:Uncharacterized protein n=1 Tax=Sphingomonas kaistensis TaxID=298708 RepID=A0A7X6BHW2_9SPHN|nr:hypothetical protein [Sphingomonas kaistensis]
MIGGRVGDGLGVGLRETIRNEFNNVWRVGTSGDGLLDYSLHMRAHEDNRLDPSPPVPTRPPHEEASHGEG